MGLSIVIPLHDRRARVEDVQEIREILERLSELAFHFPPLLVDHSLAELYSAGVGEVDLDAEEHELIAREAAIELDPEHEPDRSLMEDGPSPHELGAPARLQGNPAAIDRIRSLPMDHVGRAARVEIVRPAFRDHAEEIGYVRALDLLRMASDRIPGRDGWRRDRHGREWYSADWLGLAS